MAKKQKEYSVVSDVPTIVKKMKETFSTIFGYFKLDAVGFVHTTDKENARKVLNVRPVVYPYNVWLNKAYIVEVADKTWQMMKDKQRNLAVFHMMCEIPNGGFDPEDDDYLKKRKPDCELFMEEFAVSGGIPNWMENDEEAKDPLDHKQSKIARNPITAEAVASV